MDPLYLVRLAGIEPTTPWFVAKYSIQLSYSREASQFSMERAKLKLDRCRSDRDPGQWLMLDTDRILGVNPQVNRSSPPGVRSRRPASRRLRGGR